MSPLRAGLRFARTEPKWAFALWVALSAPALLGFVPLDRALAPLLDLRPAARLLIGGDDPLLLELVHDAPSLPGVAFGCLVVAILLAVPALWLISAFTAARSLGSRADAATVASRGIGIALVALPMKAIPIGAAALILVGARDTRTFAAALPYAIGAGIVYCVGAALITVVTDLARGAALTDDESLLGALGVGVSTVWKRRESVATMVVVELLLAALCVTAVALTRPLGLFAPGAYAVGVVALALRAFGSTALIATAARLTGGASRSA